MTYWLSVGTSLAADSVGSSYTLRDKQRITTNSQTLSPRTGSLLSHTREWRKEQCGGWSRPAALPITSALALVL